MLSTQRTLLCLLISWFSCAIPTLAKAQAPDPCATAPQTCATLINTHATAETRLPSTAVDVSVAITATAKDLPAVQRQLAEKSASLLSYLRGEKVQRLITDQVSFSPETKSSKSSADKTVGYDGRLEVSFRTVPDKAPAILSGVLDHGANTIESSTFTPTEEEIAAARRELSADATRTAMAQADAIAKAAGLRVVSVKTISVEPDNIPDMRVGKVLRYMPQAGLNMASPAIDTASGEQAYSMRVDVTVAAMH